MERLAAMLQWKGVRSDGSRRTVESDRGKGTASSTSYRRGALPRANMAIGVLLTSGGGTFRSSMPVA